MWSRNLVCSYVVRLGRLRVAFDTANARSDWMGEENEAKTEAETVEIVPSAEGGQACL